MPIEKQNKLVDLSVAFAVEILNLVKYLKEQHETIISNQIGRAGTSIGANVHESAICPRRTACGDTPLTTVTDTNNCTPKGVHNANTGHHKPTSAHNDRSLTNTATNGSNEYQIPTRYGPGFNALSATKAGNNFGAKMSIPDSIEKSGQGR